jgi:hypothetical protein
VINEFIIYGFLAERGLVTFPKDKAAQIAADAIGLKPLSKHK